MPATETFITLEGEADFACPTAGKPCKTWYKIVRDHLGNSDSSRPPVIAIHGGPGSTHHMFTSFTDLTAQYNIPIIFYDQLGCGASTHLPEKAGDESFWTDELFVNELDNLIAHINLSTYDIIGTSWGGMLASRFASKKPRGLRRLVLSNAPADLKIRYQVAEQYRRQLPEEVQAVLNKHEEAGTTSSKEYNDAFAVFSKRHILRLETLPAELVKAAEESGKDHTVSSTMSGPYRFKCTGSLREWSMVGEARKIEVPTLLINGEREIASDECLGPFWREIPKVKWVKFANSAHGPWLEERERFFRVVGDFLCDE
ncbi:proline-specific peptidase [Hyaloscypha variabilis F]|uniref:Proline-specific peptidase n=1 Tax=Hyaloscypha variabilis (strain UAMH 11265 / GT02V1 / F) TaxID=1149755 RepID=A0A2J6RTF3_HYAVF|nr:proline-specific peptidase [Hyaloscypha variabilis F]